MPHGAGSNDKSLPAVPKDPSVEVRPLPLDEDEGTESANTRSWKPSALRTPFLLGVIIFSLGLVALLQVLLLASQRNDGLLFASKITGLPLQQSFLYLYLPTVVSVVYGLTWSWIDLDAKRVEPYRQMSQPGGAKAEDSLLLHYSFDFLATVPLRSLRRKHWPVCLASTALVLVSWGITPLQAAMFATNTVEKTYSVPMLLSTKYMTAEEQQLQVTANYTYSVFGIAWLHERLPAYMSRQTAFAPFQSTLSADAQDNETWTAPTTLYSVDVECKSAVLGAEKVKLYSGVSYEQLYYTSSQGCKIPYPYGPTGNDTVGGTGLDQIKQYTALYAGYENHDGLADFYLSAYCPANASDVFLAAFAQNKRDANDIVKAATTLFCEPMYYRQNVTATIRRSDRSILNYTANGSKQPVPSSMFNPRRLEWQMNSAMQQQAVRGDVPASTWPDQTERLATLPISLQYNGAKLPMMAGMSMGAYQRPLKDYLEPETLRQSYQAAYRLLFARAMVDVLQPDLDNADAVNGTRSYSTQAVYMVPGFTYSVEGLLAAVSVLAIVLLVFSIRGQINLNTDPGSIRALMALVAGDDNLLHQVTLHDHSDEKGSPKRLAGSSYSLQRSNSGRCEITQTLTDSSVDGNSIAARASGTPDKQPAESAQPWELSLPPGVSFVALQAALLALLAYCWIAGRPYGIALPSQNRFVRQMVENYIPTIIATLIEPVWVMLNRLLCALQPLQGVRKGDTYASKSLRLNYTSLPPQLVVFKAAMNKHFMLSAVCLMALLANVLAVASGAMFNEESVLLPMAANFSQPYHAKFGEVDRHLGPWNTSANMGEGLDQFYIAVSNLTSATPMPAWTDNSGFYLPFTIPAAGNADKLYEASTTSFGANLTCRSLRQGSANSWNLAIGPDVWSAGAVANLSVSIHDASLGSMNCSASAMTIASQEESGQCPSGRLATEIVTATRSTTSNEASSGEACGQLVVAAWIRSPSPGHCMFGNGGDGASRAINLTDEDATVIACMPKPYVSSAKITVDQSSTVQKATTRDVSGTDVQSYFTGDSGNLVLQANNFLVGRRTTPGFGGGGVWHNDSFPSDWNNYIMEHIAGQHAFLDPGLPVPAVEDVLPLFQSMYNKLFAIWLGLNHDRFLLPADAPYPAIAGTVLQEKTRILVSKSMFAIAEVILALYVLVTVSLYTRRPGRNLPRLPTTLAATIATFAVDPGLYASEASSE